MNFNLQVLKRSLFCFVFLFIVFHLHIYASEYKLPWKSGINLMVQCGNFTHAAPEELYAWDFGGVSGGAYIGFPIVASRAGKVLYMVEHHPDNGTPNTDANKGNRLVIDHGDGTYALYLHLQQFSIPFENGDFVRQGEHIGNIGKSGKASGPHLHFQVQNSANSWYQQSIPITFSDPSVSKHNGIPQSEEWYFSSNKLEEKRSINFLNQRFEITSITVGGLLRNVLEKGSGTGIGAMGLFTDLWFFNDMFSLKNELIFCFNFDCSTNRFLYNGYLVGHIPLGLLFEAWLGTGIERQGQGGPPLAWSERIIFGVAAYLRLGFLRFGLQSEGFKALRTDWKYGRTSYQVGVFLSNVHLTFTLFDGNDAVGEDLALVTRLGINYQLSELPTFLQSN